MFSLIAHKHHRTSNGRAMVCSASYCMGCHSCGVDRNLLLKMLSFHRPSNITYSKLEELSLDLCLILVFTSFGGLLVGTSTSTYVVFSFLLPYCFNRPIEVSLRLNHVKSIHHAPCRTCTCTRFS